MPLLRKKPNNLSVFIHIDTVISGEQLDYFLNPIWDKEEITGWKVTSFTRSKKCNKGEWHSTEHWMDVEEITGEKNKTPTPRVPEEILKKLLHTVKGI